MSEREQESGEEPFETEEYEGRVARVGDNFARLDVWGLDGEQKSRIFDRETLERAGIFEGDPVRLTDVTEVNEGKVEIKTWITRLDKEF